MPIDRIKYMALQISGSEVIVFKAGKLKYRAIEEGFKTRLIDGTNVYDDLYFHIEFTLTIGYLAQQVVNADVEQAVIDDLDTNEGLFPKSTEVDLSDILDKIRAGTSFFPRLYDQFDAIDTTNYEVLLDQSTIDLFDAKENGRFPMYTTIKLITKDPLTAYPSWINR